MSIGHRRIRSDVFPRILVNCLMVIGLLGGQLLVISPAQAARPIAPRVGDCYSLPNSELSAPTSTRKKVSCSAPHTAETYRVAQWRGQANPATLSEVRRRGLAEQICLPWSKESNFFTNWSYKVPTSAQWRSGLRTIRCDAYVINADNLGVAQSFTGSRLDFN
jgi:hypothetical protein